MKRQHRWLFTLAALIIFLVVGGLLPGEPLSNRAMVVGFGIDMDDKNGGIIVSAQILNPDANSETTGVSSRVVSAPHDTIAGAMTKISQKAGLTVALTHCNVVLVGENVAKSPNLYSIMNYLITNSYLSENAFLFVAEGNAGELLNSKTGFGGNASLYIQKTVGMYGDYSDVNHKTLQEFVVDYHQKGQANWLPLIKRTEADPEITASSGGQSSDKPEYLFDLNSIMIFRKNEFIAEYGADGTTALNFVLRKVTKGNIEGEGANGEKIVLYILDKKGKPKYDLENKKVSFDLNIDAILKEIIDVSQEDEFVDRIEMTESEVEDAQNKIKADIEKFYSEIQALDVDVFGFYEGFNSKFGKKSADLKLQDISFEVKVKIEVRDI